jgi:Ca2+-binding RTX toxin-like protein
MCSLLAIVLPGVAHAGGPANDAFASATTVTEPLPYADSTNTTGATLESGEPSLGDHCGDGVRKTVWYSFTPSADTVVAANTFGSNFDTVLGVWEGSDLTALSLVGCNDDSQTLQSSVVFFAEMGVEYRIQIGGYEGDVGNLEFRVRAATAGFIEGTVTDADSSTPIADICVHATDVVFGGSTDFSVTADDGTYSLAARPSSYLVQFVDCRANDYVSQWWDGVAAKADATEVDVTADLVTSGIDAAMTAGCPGFASRGNQVIGTTGPDTLEGTSGFDVICGLGGDDKLAGAGESDILIGGAGNDSAHAGPGRDRLYGGSRRDALYGGPGRDALVGGGGHDVCVGGPAGDRAHSCEVERSI